ncbi:hypothetical protein [Amphiplicatus metriothermophilus]|uniref:Cytochrome c domain-containing protein n=1 Tax=Amphiplicatus metriothermophilus TaxID=1519374 RepID=A0A239PZV8_9PROT|nr:hypothetical protein [Amphiplicatus metriothermophilus]MBB5520040.1 hypothetical protein [Amphiplicatus metriothermophilus]SNT75804.1 hypothetical protein SAMN06297382_2911 [Amphiplicatus metriothermophilus]
MRRPRVFALIFAAAATATAAAAQNARDAPPLREAAWLAPEANARAALTQTPGECLRAPEGEETRYLVEVGRAAFRNPLLLGGPAARAGLSCDSCHRDGRDNPDFFLAGLSDAPGRADVTSSLFSKVREDGVFNPLPIPSLVGAGDKAVFGSGARANSLRAFIESVVTEEFQGAPPPAATLDGLAAYVAHLDEAACPDGPVPHMETRALETVDRALAAAAAALGRKDGATADLLLSSAQQALGRIHERYAGPSLAEARARLEASARDIGAVRARAGAGEDAQAVLHRIEEARAALAALAPYLAAQRGESLYDSEKLAPKLSDARR